jgi:hypothetical protein
MCGSGRQINTGGQIRNIAEKSKMIADDGALGWSVTIAKTSTYRKVRQSHGATNFVSHVLQ